MKIKSLDDHIIKVFQYYGDQELHWGDIRNELSNYTDIPAGVRNSESFSVKLSRSLNRLCREGILEKHEKGHRNVTYSLNERAREKLLKKHGSVVCSCLFVGLFKPGSTYEQVRARALKQWNRYFEDFLEPDLRRAYNSALKK